jgi:hypothetical protein
MGLFSVLKKVGQGIVGGLPGGGWINDAIDIGTGLLQGGGRGGAPKPGFELGQLPSANFTFGNDPSQINTGTGFTPPTGLNEEITLPGMDPATRQMIQGAAGTLGDLSSFASGAGKDFLSGAAGDLGGARDFYRSLSSGDAAARAEALAPELNEIRRSGKSAVENINRFGGRGGGRALAGQRAMIDTAGRGASLLSSARPMGAAGLTQLGQISGQLGLGAGNLGINAGTGAADIGLAQSGFDRDTAAKQAGLNLDRMGTLGNLDLGGKGLDLNRDREMGINQLLLGGAQMEQQGVLAQDRTRLGQVQAGLTNRAQNANAAGALGESGGFGSTVGGIIDRIKAGTGGGDVVGSAGQVPPNISRPGRAMPGMNPFGASNNQFSYNPQATPASGRLGFQYDKGADKSLGRPPYVA